MKNISITLRKRLHSDDPAKAYRIDQLTNTTTVSTGLNAEAQLHRVGDAISEEQATALCASPDYQVAINAT